MKKVLILAVAVLSVFAVSCKNGSKSADASKADAPKEEFKVPDDWQTYDVENFSISFPAMEVSSWSGVEFMNADGEGVDLDCTWGESSPTPAQLAEYGKNLKYLRTSMGETDVEDPVIDGNVLTLKSKAGNGKVILSFCVIRDDVDHGVAGSIVFDPAVNPDYEVTARNIISTIKVKK